MENLRKEFRKQTGIRLPMTKTHEAYAHYYEKYSEWLEQQLKKCILQNVSNCALPPLTEFATKALDKQQEAQMGYGQLLATEPCLNCKETVEQCACMRNICHKCGNQVGNITFTICDECWDIEFPPKR